MAACYADAAETNPQFYALERAARLLETLRDEEVLPHVANSVIRKAVESDPVEGEGREILDWCEIAAELCREKKRGAQNLRNPAGFLMKIIKDADSRRRFITEDLEISFKKRFRQREEAALRQEQEAEERTLVLEYERFRQAAAAKAFADLSDEERTARRKQKTDILKQQERYERMAAEVREREADELILNDLARSEAPPFDKWYLRRRAQQAVLPFDSDTQEIYAVS